MSKLFLLPCIFGALEMTSQIHLALTGSPESMSVSWRTAHEESSPTIEYGPADSTTTKTVVADDTRTYRAYGLSSGYYHHAEMTGLLPGNKYRYRLAASQSAWSGEKPSPWLTFTSAQKPDAESMRMIFVGDYGLGGAGPVGSNSCLTVLSLHLSHIWQPENEGQCTADAFSMHATDTSAPLDMIWVAGV
jgi:hypothetical protein